VFEGNGVQYPVFSCPEHGKSNEWEVWWDKYSTLGGSIKHWENGRDRPSCVLNCFCRTYREFFGFDYTFDYSTPIPYKNKDFTMARRILTMFRDDYMQIPNYIKWVFNKRVRSKNYPVNSFGFFASSRFVNEYKAARNRSKKPTRSTKIPSRFLDWCSEEYPEVLKTYELKTFNDLNVLIAIVNAYNRKPEQEVVKKARELKIIPKSGFIRLEK
jgi:hypothetical protein